MAKYVKWYVNIKKWSPTREQWLSLTSSVPDEELTRINRFCYKEDSKSSLIGQVLIRKFISDVIKRPSNEIQLIRSSLGRPELLEAYKSHMSSVGVWPRFMDFNVSHSGDFCILTGLWSYDDKCPALKVGVDLTKIVKKKTKHELDRFLELMSRREFTPVEWETVSEALDDRQKCVNFTRLWCLKESFIKAIGLGLTFNLRRIEFHFNDLFKYDISTEYLKRNIHTDTKVLLDGVVADNWRFQETALGDDHLVAIGYRQEDGEAFKVDLDISMFEELEIDCLLENLRPFRDKSEQNWIHFCSKQSKDHIL